MPASYSLQGGRNQSPLSADEVRRAVYTFTNLDSTVNVRHEDGKRTAFHVTRDEDGNDFGEIVFGPDIYPGGSVVDPNSGLSLLAAAAHELTHYYRWRDKTQLDDPAQEHLDEALTSLEAISRYERHLSPIDVRLLTADAILRVRLYVNGLGRATRGAGLGAGHK